ncbi:hypothetical protein E4U41_001261 [Claviceps citrina]|nr:hypothetical protein E4U41_001261 [Claviceps citrina]
MSDRFVSAGTVIPHGDEVTPCLPQDDDSRPGPGPGSGPARPHIADTSIEWAAVQKELEDARRARAAQRIKAASGEERSLYDVLQANKAAKQAAFEEQTKIRNQFRALDDDEIEFLDEVKAAKRMEEERVRRETEEGLRAFRERQRSSGAGAGAADVVDGSEDSGPGAEAGGRWGTGRKRKRGREKERVGLVKRKTGEGGEEAEAGAEKAGKMRVGGGRGGITREENGKKGEVVVVEEEEEEKKKKKKKNESAAAAATAAAVKLDVSGDMEKKDTTTPAAAATVIPAGPAAVAGTTPKQKSLLVSYGSDDSDDG